MDISIIAEIGKSPTLEVLIAALEATGVELSCSSTDEKKYQQAYERHWSIREAINATPARTLSELKAKARAAEIELERDAADCEGAGSFVWLSRALIADVLAMEHADKGPRLRVGAGVGQ